MKAHIFKVILLPLMVVAMGGNANARHYMISLCTGQYIGHNYVMNEEGHLEYHSSFETGFIAQIRVTHDNRFTLAILNLVSGIFWDSNGLSGEFVLYPDYSNYPMYCDVHSSKNIFYIGSYPHLRSYRYRLDDNSVTSIAQSAAMPPALNLAYSKYANTLFFHTHNTTSENYVGYTELRGYKLKTDDTFDTLTTVTVTGRHAIVLNISHDGKTLVSRSVGAPDFMIYRVQQDGSLRYVQSIDLPPANDGVAHFSPDDRYMYLTYDSLLDDHTIARSYSINPDTSYATLIQTVDDQPWHVLWQYEWGPFLSTPFLGNPSASITPDGRFLVIPYGMSHIQLSYIGLIRLNNGYMELLPKQELNMPDFFTASGVAVFNTNATDPDWAGYE